MDKEFNVKCNAKFGYCINNIRFVPVQLIDVAGLVPEAHLGKGRGNQFLDDLRQANLLIHIIDISGSTNEHGEQVEPLSHDPIKDVEFLETEIDMWYYQILKKGWDSFVRKVKGENLDIKHALAKQLSGLKIDDETIQHVIKELNLVHDPIKWTETDLKNLARELRKLSKPIIIAANKIDVEGSLYNLDKLKEKFPDYLIIPCSAESELALKEAAKTNLIKYIPGNDNFEVIGNLNEKQKHALDFVKTKILSKYKSTGVQQVLDQAVFNFLEYIVVYPVATNKLTDKDNNVLPDAILVKNNTTALEFAFKIHTDIGNKFVKAIDLKTKKVIGKDSKLKNKEVVEIVTT